MMGLKMSEKSDDKLINAFINPLAFLEVDEPWATHLNKTTNPENILEYMCTPGVNSKVEGFVERYKEISREKTRLFAAPVEDRILEKLVWPLRHSKACYMTGNYLGTIALGGMVSEMVAILLYELSEFQINNRKMTSSDEKALWGSSFEKLGQDKRVKILHVYNIIDDETKANFDLIRTTRKKYLHLWSQDHDSLPKDAVRTFNSAAAVVVKAIGQDIREGKIYLNPPLIKYLERKGVYTPDEDND